jgi:hypothetical protein
MLLNQRTWRRSSVVLNFDVAPRPPRCRDVQQTRVQTTPGYLQVISLAGLGVPWTLSKKCLRSCTSFCIG